MTDDRLMNTVSVTQALDALDKVVRTWKTMEKVKVKVTLSPWKRYWRVTIEEESQDPTVNYAVSDLDSHIEWTDEQLKTWPDVSRQSWQDWRFMHKSDAEKFITLYTLVWAQ